MAAMSLARGAAVARGARARARDAIARESAALRVDEDAPTRRRDARATTPGRRTKRAG
jgi:hypothetical protein